MRKQTQIFTMIVGAMLALAVICTQFAHCQATSLSKKEARTAQQQEAPQEEAQISLPSFSLPNSVHVQVNLESYCLFEIFFEESSEEIASSDMPSYTRKLFNTLFRVIISPNAP